MLATFDSTFRGRRLVNQWGAVRDKYLPPERAERLELWKRRLKEAEDDGNRALASELAEVISYEQAFATVGPAIDAIRELLKRDKA